jgi:SAM-dependent methyltransferase
MNKPRRALSAFLRYRLPSAERSARYYDLTFRLFGHFRRHYTESPHYFTWTVIADRLLRAGVRRVLDVGCGSGQLACLLHDKGLPEYVGIDFSPWRIAHAQASCPAFTFIEADVFKTSVFDTDEYDAAVALEVLEHIEQDVLLIERLRSGVLFLGSVPNFPSAAHVRHFQSSDQVLERYGTLLENSQVDEFVGDQHGKRYYLIEGVKR